MTREDFNEIIELPLEFIGRGSAKGFTFKQVYHKDGWYAYQVNDNWYEVFKETIKRKMSVVDGKFIHSKEIGYVAYPSDSDFGKWAWNVVSMKDVLDTIEEK